MNEREELIEMVKADPALASQLLALLRLLRGQTLPPGECAGT